MDNLEGRCITIARVRARLTTRELAKRLFYSVALVANWERGVRHPHWNELYAILPELPEIRKKGCAAYCPKAEVCKKDGKCPMACAAKIMRRTDPDMVPVVRCKDCKHYERGECYHERHNHHSQSIQQNEDDFCSYGERRATNEAD